MRIVYRMRMVLIAVDLSATREFLEFHDILGQSSRLVREDIRHLAKLIVQITRLHSAGEVLLSVVNFNIPCHKQCLKYSHYLNRYHKGDRYEIGEH